MKAKIALILCFVLMFSALTSCQNPTEANNSSVTDSSENEVTSTENVTDESSTDESQDVVTQIPENVIYFTGNYSPRGWNEHDGYLVGVLNEKFSYGNSGLGLTGYLEENKDTLDKTNTYFYVGINLYDSAITDPEELDAKRSQVLKQVDFIPTDEPYMNKDYMSELLKPFMDMEIEEFAEIYDEVVAPITIEHAQNLMPGVDISGYQRDSYYEFRDFTFWATGYVTADALDVLVENFEGVIVTWLPAPDDRGRFLTYISPYKIED